MLDIRLKQHQFFFQNHAYLHQIHYAKNNPILLWATIAAVDLILNNLDFIRKIQKFTTSLASCFRMVIKLTFLFHHPEDVRTHVQARTPF